MTNVSAKTGCRILIIEDEKSVSSFLLSILRGHHPTIRIEESGTSGIQGAIEFRPELIILDLGLPDLSGLSVLKRIREWSKVPIIILTASDADEDKVEALDNGADDYLTKPFSVPEILARIRVALRHANVTEDISLFQGRIKMDLDGHRVFLDGNPIKLTATEFDILKVLLKNAGKIVTQRALLKEVWGPNSVEHPQYLRVYVGHLRKKLSLNGFPDLIVTEPGIGYRLIDKD